MSPAKHAVATRPSTTWWRTLAGVLALVGTGCLFAWANQPGTAASEPTYAPTSAAPAPNRPDAQTIGAPTRLRIPSLHVSTALVHLGLNADRTVEVPQDPDLAGWYDLGARPGASGSAVILGHVDSADGPAVFARLRELRRGDRMHVDSRDGTTSVFVVTSVRTFLNADFPAQRVYARTGGRFLNVVTCGGAYDADQGGYQSNVVVSTRWLRTSA